MSTETAAYAGALLEGVDLPATKQRLIAYAREQDGGARVAEALAGVPDREYRTLDEVGEALAPVQPQRSERTKLPRPESGAVAGGDDYTHPHLRPGRVEDEIADGPGG